MAPQFTGTNGLSLRGPLAVDQARHQFLAGARLATDVDRRLAACQLGDGRADCLHDRGVAKQGVAAAPVAFGKAGEFQRPVDEVAQYLQVDGLGYEIESAQLEGLYRGFHLAVGGDHGDRQIGVLLLDGFDQFQAVAVGQTHVGQTQIEVRLAEQTTCIGQVGRGPRVDIHASERQLKQLANIRFVVDNQGLGFVHGCWMISRIGAECKSQAAAWPN